MTGTEAKSLRVALGANMRQVAAESGVSIASICRFEKRGKLHPILRKTYIDTLNRMRASIQQSA